MDEPRASDPEAFEREQEESLIRVEAGGITLGAERRLRELSDGGGAFTSDLSVNDFAMCHRLGLAPLAQVMGSSIYQVGYQAAPWPTFGAAYMFELEALSGAWNEVRDRALARLSEEAAHVGADAVVGVDLRTGEFDWAENAIEYVIVGTAVRDTRRQRAGSSPPILTELSVADYAKLSQAGVEALGVVAWSSAFFVRSPYASQMTGLGFTQNQELTDFTQGVYSARESVVGRISDQARRMNADGVIGMRIQHRIIRTALGGGRYEQGGLMVTFHAIGTAIRENAADHFQAPRTTIDLTL